MATRPGRSRPYPDPKALRRQWFAKNLALWLLITPLCTVVAIAIGIDDGHLTTTLLTIISITVVPLGALGFSAWLGIWFPYHPLPLRYRWANRRRRWPMIFRWIVLVLAPYGLVPALTAVLTLPSVLLWTAVAPSRNSRITDAQFAPGCSSWPPHWPLPRGSAGTASGSVWPTAAGAGWWHSWPTRTAADRRAPWVVDHRNGRQPDHDGAWATEVSVILQVPRGPAARTGPLGRVGGTFGPVPPGRAAVNW